MPHYDAPQRNQKQVDNFRKMWEESLADVNCVNHAVSVVLTDRGVLVTNELGDTILAYVDAEAAIKRMRNTQ